VDEALSEHLRNQRLVDRLFAEVLNGGDLDVLPQIYSEQVVDHNPLPGAPPGIDGVRHSISATRDAVPDCHYTVLRVSSEGDTVTVRATFSGTQTGRLLLRQGNGRWVESTLNIAFRIADGRIVERRVVSVSLATTASADAPSETAPIHRPPRS
jgi:predicted ester cyclase